MRARARQCRGLRKRCLLNGGGLVGIIVSFERKEVRERRGGGQEGTVCEDLWWGKGE